MTARTIAVTGANGFLGRNCIRKAVGMGLNVRGIVRREEAADLVRKLGGEPVIVKQLDKQTLTRAFEDCQAVLHFIGIVNEQYGTFEEVNVRGTQLVLESAEQSHISRFVTPSGLGVNQYGKKDWATNGYFASKRKIELICQSGSVTYVVFRPSYILGPEDELIPNLVDSILSGNVQVAGEGNTPMQPIFVEDAETAFLRAAMGQGRVNSVYDLVGPETITFVQFTARVADAMHQEGFKVPGYRVTMVPPESAPQTMGLSREEVDVMLCDEVGDPKPFVNDLNVAVTPLDKAIHAAVRAVKEYRQ
jgi:nucleoside-diphosphate-sugar epimerase